MSAVHYNRAVSLATGLPYPYAVGVQMHSWDINLLTNWMGDEGWLKKCYCEYRKFVYFSDVVWLRGKVTKKYIDENNEYSVDIETSAINQRGENVMPGRATVLLPSRENNAFPVSTRLQRTEN
jgi:hypothetical protein